MIRLHIVCTFLLILGSSALPTDNDYYGHGAIAGKRGGYEMDANGFYGDTFSGGFGSFYTVKKRGGVDPLLRRLLAKIERNKILDQNLWAQFGYN